MKKLATVLIVVGILVALSPLIGKLYFQWQENRMIDEYYNTVDATEAESTSEAVVNPEEAYGVLNDAFSSEARNGNEQATDTTSASDAAIGIQTQDGKTTPDAAVKPTAKPQAAASQKVLGIIKIDKIKIKYPVVEGVKASNLRRAIGHIPGTAGLGQPGNCALAGHRNYTFGRYFNRLDEVKAGDIVSISTKKAEYRYKVYEKLVVKPDDVSVIKGGKDDTVLTLITCTPIYIATHRLILHARLEETILLEP